MKYIPRIMHRNCAFVCFASVIFYPYPSGLRHWHWGNCMIAPVPVKQPWRIWVNKQHELHVVGADDTSITTSFQCYFVIFHYDGRAPNCNPGRQYPHLYGPVHTPDNKGRLICPEGRVSSLNKCNPIQHLMTTGGTPHLYNRGSSMLVNSLHSGENNM